MLRVNRLLAESDEWSKTSIFAAAFRGGSYPMGVSESTVSRWETAKVRPTYAAVRRYEEVLGLRPGLLVAAADTVYRYAAPSVAAPVLARAEAGAPSDADLDQLERLVERALSTEAMSGADWDDLTGRISAIPALVLVPRERWSRLAGRLLEESAVSGGLAWMQRFESINRLLGHPAGRAAAIAACASLAADRTWQVVVEPVSLLDASSHPDAARHVLSQLSHPTNEKTRYGALLACVRKVQFGHFTGPQLAGLAPLATQLLTEPDSHADAAPLAAELLRRMPAGVRGGVLAGLRRALSHDRTLSEVLTAGRLAARLSSDFVVDRIVATTRSTMDREPAGFVDGMLAPIVDEMLYAPVLDVRLYAAMLVRATPYRSAVAGALAAELARTPVATDATLASSLLGALRVLGGDAERRLVERLVLAPGLPLTVTQSAVHCVGHVGGVSSDQFWRQALASHGRLWRTRPGRAGATTLSGLVYGLGMAGNTALLNQVRDDPHAPAPVRAAASWWLDRPAYVYAGTRL
jgi:transcriptional regulator with XRE-family HTH domain